jgi:hypothetical protein
MGRIKMKTLIMTLFITLALSQGISTACSILNEEEVQIGTSKGIKGICSNNRLPITCVPMQNAALLQCDGPSGAYSGSDPDVLVDSACGCNEARDEQKRLEKELPLK